MLSFLEHRVLPDGTVIFVHERDIMSHTGFTWFEIGMKQRQLDVNPCHNVPLLLLADLARTRLHKNESQTVEVLLKIGDWLSGWKVAQILGD